MKRTHLAVVLSLMGCGLPWHATARAAGVAETPAVATRHGDAHEATIRSFLGLANGTGTSPAERRAPTFTRRSGPTVVGDGRWDAAALGLAKPPRERSIATGGTRDDGARATSPLDEPSASTERIRSILGLGPRSEERRIVAVARPAPPGRSSVRPGETEARASDTRSPQDAPAMSSEIAASSPPGSDRPEPSEWMLPLPDIALTPPEHAGLVTPDSAPRPDNKRHDDPAPAIADASSTMRRIGTRPAASRLLPPGEFESLDVALRDRLHGQFELPGRELRMSDGVARLATDDPLVSLLQVLAADEAGEDRPAPIVFVASSVEHPQRAAVAADVFRRMADGMQRLGDAALPDETAATPGDAWPAPQDTPIAEAANDPSAAISVAKFDHVDFYIDAFDPTQSMATVATPSTSAGAGAVGRPAAPVAAAGPLLPKNPFAWFGEDAIDLSASLVDHPLLLHRVPDVATIDPSRELLMMRSSPAVEAPALVPSGDRLAMVEPRFAAMADLPWKEMASPRIAAVVPIRNMQSHPSTVVDIFDPKLDLPRVGAGSPRPATAVVSAGTPAEMTGDRAQETVPVLLANIEPSAAARADSQKAAFHRDDVRFDPLGTDRVAIADTQLERMRGGFETDSGLRISFGIERAVYINGNLVTTTSLNVADLSRLTAGQAQTLGIDRSTLGVIQSGPNNAFSAGQIGSSSVATVIQNTLNDQKIQGITAINATVNSLDLLRKTDMQQSIQSALAGSIRR